jgi:hypothetical protein
VYLNLLITGCVLSGVVTVVSFFGYVRNRMQYREDKERRFQQVHFSSLVLFVVFGVLILIELSHRYNPPRIRY